MDIFIDSADIEDIKKAMEYGVCSGCTTNPSLIKKAIDKLKARGENVNMEDYIKMICETLGEGRPVSLEVISLDADSMIKEAETLYKKFNSIANNVVIKIPVNTATSENGNHYEGLKAVKALSEKGIPINATLVFTPEQALLAAKARAKYVSPFAGRVDDFIRTNAGIKFEKPDYFPAEGRKEGGRILEDNGIVSGVDLVARIVDIFANYDLEAKIIAASMRNARQVREVAELGVDIATVPFYVIEQMLKHPKTFEGIVKFSKDVVPEYRNLFS